MNLCTHCGTEQILNYFFWQATQTLILLWAAPSSTSYFTLITHKQDSTRPYEAWQARNNEHRCQRAEVRWIRWDHMVSQATPSAPWMADNLKGKGIPLHFVFTVPYPPNLPWLHFPRSCSLFEVADITGGSSHSVIPPSLFQWVCWVSVITKTACSYNWESVSGLLGGLRLLGSWGLMEFRQTLPSSGLRKTALLHHLWPPVLFLPLHPSWASSTVPETIQTSQSDVWVCYETGNYLNEFPLPGLQDGSGLFLVPVDVMDLIVIFKVLIELFGTHEEEHGLKSLRTIQKNTEGWVRSERTNTHVQIPLCCKVIIRKR